jgi:hypothetical protein
VGIGSFHEVQLHVRVSDGLQEVWYDGTFLPDLSGAGKSLGSTPVGRIQLGNTGSTAFSAVFDDVVVNTTQIASDFSGDTTPPTGPTLSISGSGAKESVSGTTVYYDPSAGNSGAFTVNATTSDPQSGIASVAFPTIFGNDGGTLTTAPYAMTYVWDSTATASGTGTVTATNGSGLTAGATFQIVPDTTPPNPFTLAGLTNGSFVHNGTPLAASLTDSGSGIAGITFGYCLGTTCDWGSATTILTDTTAPYTMPWYGQPADGDYTLLARATDRVGNITDAPPITIAV